MVLGVVVVVVVVAVVVVVVVVVSILGVVLHSSICTTGTRDKHRSFEPSWPCQELYLNSLEFYSILGSQEMSLGSNPRGGIILLFYI